MNPGRRLPSRMLPSESFLIGILRLIGLIPWPTHSKKRRAGRPYVYPPLVMLRCFIVRIWMRIPSNNALHSFFLLSAENPYNARVMVACGLDRVPDRRTFDRRLKNIASDGGDEDLRPKIAAMGRLFVAEGLVDPYIASVDSTLLKAKGHVWHASSMEKNVVPYSGIDTDARWGTSKTKGWVFGYKLHLVSSTGSLIVPLSADFTTANASDSKVYGRVTASLRGVRYVDGDEGYDVDDLYELSRERGFDLVCPIARYENTHPERVELVFFYESELGQLVYSWRSKSVEPLFEQIKDVFGIDPLPVRGFDKAKTFVLLSVLVYQLTVYHNHVTGRPLRALKHMLGS